jgi:pyruvate-formate lyase-activating enzyme
MQASIFNVRVPLDGSGDVFLMNTFTDAQLIVSREVSELLDRISGHGFVPTVAERQAVATLAENGFIVENREADRRNIERFFDDFRAGQDQLRVTVLTTLQCNFACDYCIQGDHGDYNKNAAKMSMETASRTAEWTEARLDAVRPRSFALTFFGGEPLLNLPVMYYLAERLWRACAERGVEMLINVITNGLLLTPDVVDRLKPFGLSGVKITLDGDRDTHNRMRPLRGGQGTFDKILNNIRLVADKCRIAIGGNFDESSVDSYPALLDFLRDQDFADKLVKVAFKPIIREQKPAPPKGMIPLMAVAGDGHRRRDRERRLRLLPLPRRQDGVSARRDDEARVQDRGRRAHGTVRNPQDARAHHRPGRVALCVPRVRRQRAGGDRPHRRPLRRAASRGSGAVREDRGVGRVRRLRVHPGVRRRLQRRGAYRARRHEQAELPQTQLRSRCDRARAARSGGTARRTGVNTCFAFKTSYGSGRKEQDSERQEKGHQERDASPVAG